MTSAPYLIGSAETAGAVSTTVITPSVSTAAGDTLVVAASISSTGFAVTSVSDSAGNAYALKASSTTQNPTFVYVSPGPSGGPGGAPTAALSGASAITVTWNTTGGSRIAAAVGCSGLLGSVDQNPATTSAASGTAASITSAALGGFPEACVAVCTNGNSGGAGGTWAAGWTPPLLAPTLAGSGGQYMSVAARVVSSTSAVTASFTLGTSSKWCMALLTFEYAITISPSSLPATTTASVYSQVLTAAGGTGSYTWSVASGSLPPGLALSSGGTISGTPGAGGTYSFTVQAADGGGHSATQPLSLAVTAVFPLAPLDAWVELNLDGWTGITSYALQREGTSPPITITRGRADETSSLTPSACGMQWNNRDGRFSPRNPTGPYYGLLGRNTPVRVSVPGAGTALRLEDDMVSYASTGAVAISSGLDVRLDFEPSGYWACVLFRQAGSFVLYLNADGSLTFVWTDSANTAHGVSTPAGTPIPLGRFMLRTTLNFTTGTVTWYTAPDMGGTQTQLVQVTGAGATSLHAGTGPLSAGGPADGVAPFANTAVTGLIYEFAVYDGIGGTLKANPQFYGQTPGVTSFADTQGNTWVLQGTATIDSRDYRGHFEVSSLPQQWDPTGTDVWTPVAGSGIMRRLQQGSSPVMSAMRRAITSLSGDLAPAAYWPCEDPQGSTFIASGIPGGNPMYFTAVPGFQGTAGSPSADQNFPCSAQLPTLAGSTLVGYVGSTGTTWTDNVIRFLWAPPSGGDGDGAASLCMVVTKGTAANLLLVYQSGAGGLQLQVTNAAGSLLGSLLDLPGPFEGKQWRVSVNLRNAGGGTVTTELEILQPGAPVATVVTSSFTGTIGAVTEVRPGEPTLLTTVTGHYSVQGTWESLFDQAQPLNAWLGEPAGTRFARLCTENGINYRVSGFPAISQLMGYQTIDTLANLLSYVEITDRGLLYEPAQCLGLGYRTLGSLCNQAPAAVLDYPSAQIGGDGSTGLAPVDDDQYTINDVTVSRNDGSSAQIQVTTGTLSIAAPPDGVGDYATSLTAYCAYDTQLQDIAGWVAHVGTTDEERYPQVPLNLARSQLAAILNSITAAGIGDRAQVTNPPAWLPPGDIDQLIWGVTEKLGGFWHLLAWNTVPASPYSTVVLDDLVLGRVDTSGTVLAGPASTSATTLQITGDTWTTAGGDFPFDAGAGGEQVTVTGIAASGTGNTLAGVFLNPSAMGLSSWSAAQAVWTAWTGDTAKVTRVYMGNSYAYTTDMQAMVAAGVKMLLDITPNYNPVSSANLASLTTLMQTLQAAGAKAEVSLWHEPFFSGLSAAQFTAMIAYYGPAVRAYYPLVFCGSGPDLAAASGYYPGDTQVDKIACDDYVFSDSAAGAPGSSLANAASIANSASPPKPLGLWEVNGSTDPVNGQSQSTVTAWFASLTTFFQGRIAAGLANADIVLFSGAGGANWLGCATTQNAGYEGGTGNWFANSGCTVGATSAQAHSGTGSLALTATGTANMVTRCFGTFSNGLAVTPGQQVKRASWFRAATTGRSLQVAVNWWSATGTLLSTSFGGSGTDTTTGWVQVIFEPTAPASAAFATPGHQVISPGGSGEVHYSDDDELCLIEAIPSLTTTVEFGWDYRIALWQALFTALNNTSKPQVMTVTRSVNGVVKTHPAGTAVALFTPPILALS